MTSFVSHGKGNSLDMISQFSPKLAGNYLRILGDDSEFVNKALSFMQKSPQAQFILRSDSTIEDSVIGEGDDLQIATYAGLFDSYDVEATEKNIQETRETISSIHNLATDNPSTIAEYIGKIMANIKKDIKEYGNEIKATRTDIRKGEDNDYSGDSIYFNTKYIQRLAAELKILKKVKNSKNVSIVSLEKFIEELINTKGNVGHKVEEQLKLAKDIKKYSDFRGADISLSKMNFVLHQKYEGINVLIAEHPNIEGQIHMESLLPLIGPNPRDDRLWRSDNFRINGASKFDKDFYNIISAFSSIFSKGRKEGVLREDVAYMAEAIAGPQKILQIRPYFKRKIVPENEYELPQQGLGVLPVNGFSFEWDANKKRYSGLHTFNPRFHTKDDKDLPYDVINQERVNVMTVQSDLRVANNYLSHQGIRNIEGARYFQTISFNLQDVWGEPKIRFSGPNGLGSFSKLL